MVGLAPGAVPRVREEAKTKAAGSSTPITIREPKKLHDRRRQQVADLLTRSNPTCGLHPGWRVKSINAVYSRSQSSCQEFQDVGTACTLGRVQEVFQVSVSYKRPEKVSSN